jgi:hypothetical protein
MHSPAFGAAPRFGTASPAFGASARFGTRSPAFAGSSRFGVRFGTGFRRPFVGPRRFHDRFFFSSFTPFYFGYYGYPTYYSDYSYSAGQPYPYPSYDYYAAQSSYDMAQQQQDIDRLEAEVERLKEERESSETASAKPPVENKSEPSTPTLLVFRDKHTQEVQNYAVIGGTLWIFNEQRATKLPLSWLDIDATTKANEDRGVNFRVPN